MNAATPDNGIGAQAGIPSDAAAEALRGRGVPRRDRDRGHYHRLRAVWNQKTTDMQNVLSQYGPVLDEMKGNYATTDNNLALQWSGIG